MKVFDRVGLLVSGASRHSRVALYLVIRHVGCGLEHSYSPVGAAPTCLVIGKNEGGETDLLKVPNRAFILFFESPSISRRVLFDRPEKTRGKADLKPQAPTDEPSAFSQPNLLGFTNP